MKQPIYLPMRDRLVLRHAAKALDYEAAVIHNSHHVDGVILDRKAKREHDDYRDTAAALRRIARNRTNKEPAK